MQSDASLSWLALVQAEKPEAEQRNLLAAALNGSEKKL